MTIKKSYSTKHQEELLEYMKQTAGTHVTAGDICMHMRACGKNIGTATVYRHLEKMVDEGIVNKYIIDEGSSACYEYVTGCDTEHGSCYHLKCESCGKLIHLGCDEISALNDHIREHHGFTINPRRTVFYGICEDCAG
ncbi:Fur family transcriptional regulator, ferric uptake regulator [Ruminococcaceae bacterium YRB3002]|nr:Fur family transcriptional regulator, ferric uptake regulator [Ruminococcaceae bacterium YRB3002]